MQVDNETSVDIEEHSTDNTSTVSLMTLLITTRNEKDELYNDLILFFISHKAFLNTDVFWKAIKYYIKKRVVARAWTPYYYC